MQTVEGAGRAAPPARSPGERAARVAAILLALVVVAAATMATISVLGQRTRRTSTTYAAVPALEVRADAGDVQVLGGDRADIRVDRTDRYSWGGLTGGQRLQDGVLRLNGHCSANVLLLSQCSTSFRVELPAGTRVTVRTGSGDVLAQGLRAPAELHSGSGDVEARDLSGGLVAGTRSGDVVVQGLSGQLSAETGSGDVVAGGLSVAGVRASTRSGDVRLVLTAVPDRVSASSGSGDLWLSVPDAVYRVDAPSQSGDVRTAVRQDPDASRVIAASTRSGDVHVNRG